MPGQFRTSQDLVDEVLATLGVKAAGQPTDPEDFNYVNEKIDAVFRKLGGHGIYAPDPNSIPGAWFSDLTDIVAGECALKFGQRDDQRVALINKGFGGEAGVEPGGGAAMKSLKAIQRNSPSYEILQSDYF